jgi:hypothetical protein
VWTYNLAALSQPLYQVRLLLGDTQINAPLLQDEEIGQYLAAYSNPYYAAAYAAEAIAGTFSRQVDRTLSGLSLTNSQKVMQYMTLARSLRRQGALSAVPYAGGQSVADKQDREQNNDRVAPEFTKSTFDVPGLELPMPGNTKSNPLTGG